MEAEIKVSTEISTKKQEYISFFEKDVNFVFVFKKTEKLVSAIYMVTNLFSDNEPVKWDLRKKSNELLSFTVSYEDVNESNYSSFVHKMKSMVLNIISLLEISSKGGLLSSMNFSILNREFVNLLEVLESGNLNKKDSSYAPISGEYFDRNQIKISSVQNQPNQHFSDNGQVKDISPLRPKDEFKRSNRQNIILNLLKKKKDLTIKDISLVIKDCSEKTIQRELNSFISAGVLKRTGERRWSKYSLV